MSSNARNAVFDMDGHYVRELKIVLGSASVIEGFDYQDVEFDEALSSKGKYQLKFSDPKRATDALEIWRAHLISRPAAATNSRGATASR